MVMSFNSILIDKNFLFRTLVRAARAQVITYVKRGLVSMDIVVFVLIDIKVFKIKQVRRQRDDESDKHRSKQILEN